MSDVQVTKTYKSQLPIGLRVVYAGIFLAAAIALMLKGSAYSIIIAVLFLLLAALSFFYYTFIEVKQGVVEAGIMGLALVKWHLSDVSSVAYYSRDKLPVFYSWLFGIYLRDGDALFLASGREAIGLRNEATDRHVLVSAENCGELVELLKN